MKSVIERPVRLKRNAHALRAACLRWASSFRVSRYVEGLVGFAGPRARFTVSWPRGYSDYVEAIAAEYGVSSATVLRAAVMFFFMVRGTDDYEEPDCGYPYPAGWESVRNGLADLVRQPEWWTKENLDRVLPAGS